VNVPFLAFLPHGLDWIWIVLLVLLLFGPKKLPELARGLGKSLGEFKKAKEEFNQELQASMKEQPKPDASGGVTVPPGTVATTSSVPAAPVVVQKVQELPPQSKS